MRPPVPELCMICAPATSESINTQCVLARGAALRFERPGNQHATRSLDWLSPCMCFT
jgi:hypothetical protein